MGDIKVCTISKYPPYMSGHSFEALYQCRALLEMTGKKHYEVTYDQSMYDQEVNYNNSPELLQEAEEVAEVYRILPDVGNVKVFDGALTKAFMGRVINLVAEHGVNVISTFYLDPHALIANQAKLYAKNVLGKDIVVAHKAVGSDVLNSIANHLNDGEGRAQLLQLLMGDIMLAVSEYTKDKLVEYAHEVLPLHVAQKIADETKILYAPFDHAYFQKRDDAQIQAFKKKYKLPDNALIISYFGRLFPEKGVEDLLAAWPIVKAKYPDAVLIVGGQGISSDKLKQLVQEQNIPNVIFTGAVSNAEKRALMQLSKIGVIPTKPVLNFIETLCICALEYQAAGAPLITTRVGGVPEAAGPHSLYAKHSSPKDLAAKILSLLGDEDKCRSLISAGQKHIKKFDYYEITKTLVGYVEEHRAGLQPNNS